MAADQITAENKEEINADPAEAIEAARCLETKECGVVDGDNDDGKCAKKIEARLALTICEARIDGGIGRWLVNGWKLAALGCKKKNPLPTVRPIGSGQQC
ncbi:MAG TPA: hypothetical protein VH188_03870 [Chthoniobacterales bacterium]|nr:hypothetical protein [Chthoniobacterales bacterium]